MEPHVSAINHTWFTDTYEWLLDSQAVGELLKGEVKVVCGNFTLKRQHVECFHEAERGASRRILQGSGIELISEQLLDVCSRRPQMVALAELYGYRMETIGVYHDKASRSDDGRRAPLSQGMA